MIMCRFAEPTRAKVFGLNWLNEYSGKWNHHYEVGAGSEELHEFKRQLERILGDTKQQNTPVTGDEP
jgi:hypothetical protein